MFHSALSALTVLFHEVNPAARTVKRLAESGFDPP